MLLAPTSNSSPPFGYPTHLESYHNEEDKDTNRTVPLEEAFDCQPGNDADEVRRSTNFLTQTTSEGKAEAPTENDHESETTIGDHPGRLKEDYQDDNHVVTGMEGPREASPTNLLRLAPPQTSPSPEFDQASLSILPHPSNSIRPLPLPSALKSTKRTRKHRVGVSRRRVRGLWGSREDAFSQLHQDSLQGILSYLSLADTCVLSMVSRRWNYLANREATYQTVDATDFVQRAYEHFAASAPPTTAACETAQALANILQKHTPRSLTIRNIGNKLCPDTYLPSLKGLRHLCLEGFATLTDTHIHVWMLSSTAGHGRVKDIYLRDLELENCPKLTNAAVNTLARHCSHLQSLSMSGCPLVDNLEELSNMWKVEGKLEQHVRRSSSCLSHLSSSSLLSLDGPIFGDHPPFVSRPTSPPAPSLRPGSPPLGSTSPKDLLKQGMSLFFEPLQAELPQGSLTESHANSKPSEASSSRSVEGVSSLFIPPPSKKNTPSLASSMADVRPKGLPNIFQPAAVKPKASTTSTLPGLFAPPLSNSPKPEESLLGMFKPPSKLPPRPPSASLSGLFTPPGAKPTQRQPSTVGSGLFGPPADASTGRRKPPPLSPVDKSSPSLAGLFAPPPSTAAPSTLRSGGFEGLTAPPNTPTDAKSRADASFDTKDTEESDLPSLPSPKTDARESEQRSKGSDNLSNSPPFSPRNTYSKPRPSPSATPAAGLEALFRPPVNSSLHWTACLCLLLLSLHTTNASSTDTYAQLPPSVFAPGGRLVSVEHTLQAVQADRPLQNNLVVAIQCDNSDSIVVVTSEVPSPYLFVTNTTSNAGDNDVSAATAQAASQPLLTPESSGVPRPPFCRLTSRVWGITGGSVADGQLLRLQMHRVAEQFVTLYSNEEESLPMLARALADERQIATQQPGETDDSVLYNATALVFAPGSDNGGLWRIDPSGQFFRCQAAIVGRQARAAEATLVRLVSEQIAGEPFDERSSANKSPAAVDPAQLQAHLASLTVEEARRLAVQAMRLTLTDTRRPSPIPLTLRAMHLSSSLPDPKWWENQELS